MPFTDATQTHSVEVDGARVTWFDSVAEGELERPLVLVHGSGGTTATHFGHLFPMMATRTRVIAVDWSPLADPDTELSLDHLVSQVRGAVDAALGVDTLTWSATPSAPWWPRSWLPNSASACSTSSWWPAGSPRMPSSDCATRSGARSTTATTMPGPLHRILRLLRPSIARPDPRHAGRCARHAQAHGLPGAADGPQCSHRHLRVGRSHHCPNPHRQLHRRHDGARPSPVRTPGAIDDARLTYITSGHAFFLERPAELMHIVDLFLREPDRHPVGAIIPETHS